MNTKIAFVRKVGYGWSVRGFGGYSRFAGRWSISGVMIESQELCSSFRIDCMIVHVTLQYVGWEKIQLVAACWALFVAKVLVVLEVYWDLLRYFEDLKDLKKGKILSVLSDDSIIDYVMVRIVWGKIGCVTLCWALSFKIS